MGGAEASLPVPTTPQPLGRGFPLPSPPASPLPLKIVPHLGGAKRPLLDNHALCLIVCNAKDISQPHPYAFCDPNAPHITMTYFPQLQYPPPASNCFHDPNPKIFPSRIFSLDPPSPYSIFDPITQSESDDSDVFPQTPLIMILIQIGICNPSPHTPLYLNFKYLLITFNYYLTYLLLILIIIKKWILLN